MFVHHQRGEHSLFEKSNSTEETLGCPAAETTGVGFELGLSVTCIGRLIDLARAKPVAVTKHGRPVIVVIAVEEFERPKALDEPTPPAKRNQNKRGVLRWPNR